MTEFEEVEQERDNAILERDAAQERVMKLQTELFQAKLELSRYTSVVHLKDRRTVNGQPVDRATFRRPSGDAA